jgi:hypothetical protein
MTCKKVELNCFPFLDQGTTEHQLWAQTLAKMNEQTLVVISDREKVVYRSKLGSKCAQSRL